MPPLAGAPSAILARNCQAFLELVLRSAAPADADDDAAVRCARTRAERCASHRPRHMPAHATHGAVRRYVYIAVGASSRVVVASRRELAELLRGDGVGSG